MENKDNDRNIGKIRIGTIGEFQIGNDERGLWFLGHRDDPAQMNWVEGEHCWGTVKAPQALSVSRELFANENGEIEENYIFENVSDAPLFVQKKDVSIYVPFNDSYEKAEIGLEKRCNAHLFVAEDCSYVMALRQGGRGPHLGLVLTKGSLSGYGVERDFSNRSEDRGDFVVYPKLGDLDPGEKKTVSWKLFWHQGKDDFYARLLREDGFLLVQAKQMTCFKGETFEFTVSTGNEETAGQVRVSFGKTMMPASEIRKEDTTQGSVYHVHFLYPAEKEGEYRFAIEAGGKQTHALFYCSASVEELLARRCRFLAEKQQYKKEGSPLDGAYLIYDAEENGLYYSHTPDHNGGRERLAMGVIMAQYLQRHPEDLVCMESLNRYESYVYRELYDEQTGVVYNDIGRNNDWHRLYNYPWMATFQMELYRLKKEEHYLLDAFRTMMAYYQAGGEQFYAIGIEAYELKQLLEQAGLKTQTDAFVQAFLQHADQICRMSIHYPTSEVKYEQSIVAPAVSCLLQAYQISGETKYLEEAKKQLALLELFNGRQADYHLFETAIRHWDGYWFGKYRNYGDTFPHYWSALTGEVYARYAQITNDASYREKAKASIRGCLNLFFADGTASCAMVYPDTVNGKSAHYYDPWANDQDWALYYAVCN